MFQTRKLRATARCACGGVELTLIGAPILSAVCHCDDCQEGSRRLEALADAPPIRDPEGGTPYVLYRKDRFTCEKGEASLRSDKLRETSSTRRVFAACCHSAMFLEVERGHWISVYRARIQGEAPPVQMRVCRKREGERGEAPSDVPTYPTYPLRFLAKLVAARIGMLLPG
ncbi:Hypothetical protein A7982_09653 [Minicystis rosea]|nr:Hypothetical protein A7982_09653 [Minicystis rosea]